MSGASVPYLYRSPFQRLHVVAVADKLVLISSRLHQKHKSCTLSATMSNAEALVDAPTSALLDPHRRTVAHAVDVIYDFALNSSNIICMWLSLSATPSRHLLVKASGRNASISPCDRVHYLLVVP